MKKKKTMKVIDETKQNFTLEFVYNGAILTYEDGTRCVVQGDEKEIFAFIGEYLKSTIIEVSNYDIEITIKAKE